MKRLLFPEILVIIIVNINPLSIDKLCLDDVYIFLSL